MTPKKFHNKRLKDLEAKAAQQGIIFTDAQAAALGKSNEEKISQSEIKTIITVIQTLRIIIINIKRVGHLYQQTFTDTCTKVALIKLYDRKKTVFK